MREKLYTGTVEHDNILKINKFIKEIYKEAELDPQIYSLPMAIPRKKILQYVFTLKKLQKKTRFLK